MSEHRQPNPLLARLGGLLEAALERALALDPETRARVATLDGRSIGIDLSGTPLALAIRVDGERLRVGPHWQADSDLGVRGAPASLLAFALRRNEGTAAPAGKVEVSGDADLARQVEKLAREFRPDVDEAFARAFGDVIGVPLARGMHAAFAWSRDSARAALQDGAEFLRDDTRDLVAPAEIDDFLDAVDALRELVDRLGARIAGIASRMPGEAP